MAMLTAAVLVAGACSGDDGADDEAVTTSSTTEAVDDAAAPQPDADFRTVFSDDGNAMVIVPGDETRDITVDVLDPADYPEFLAGAEQSEGTVVYDLGPDGATFDEPVRFFRRVEVANVDPDGSLDLFDVPLLLTYTTDDDGQPVMAESPSLLRAGSSVWVGSSFDHFSPAITINTQEELSTNEVFGQLINSITVKKDGPPAGDQRRSLPPAAEPDPVLSVPGGLDEPVRSPSLAGRLGDDVPIIGDLDPSVDLSGLPFVGNEKTDADFDAALDALAASLENASADVDVLNQHVLPTSGYEVDGSRFDGTADGQVGIALAVLIDIRELANPFGGTIDTEIEVGVEVSTPSIEQALADFYDGIAGGPPSDDPDPIEAGVDPTLQMLGMPFDARAEVTHFDLDSLIRLLLFGPDAPPMELDGYYLFSIAGDPAFGPVQVTGAGQLESGPDGPYADMRIDRYGAWRVAISATDDGFDPSQPLEIVRENGTDFLVVDGARTSFPTSQFSTSDGPLELQVDASEGQIFESQIFADGFESGDTSAWTTAN